MEMLFPTWSPRKSSGNNSMEKGAGIEEVNSIKKGKECVEE